MHIREEKLPRARELSRAGQELSREAQVRLGWMDFYGSHGRNAALTSRHFGISRQTFYRWWRRYDPHDPRTLESRSHRPDYRRQPTWTPKLAEPVFAWRRRFPRWGKDKLVVLLRRQHPSLCTSMVGRILRDLKKRGVLGERCGAGSAAPRWLRPRPFAVRKPKD